MKIQWLKKPTNVSVYNTHIDSFVSYDYYCPSNKFWLEEFILFDPETSVKLLTVFYNTIRDLEALIEHARMYDGALFHMLIDNTEDIVMVPIDEEKSIPLFDQAYR